MEAPAGTLTIDMGNVTNVSDANGANDFFIIEIDARVLDVPGNAAGNPPLTNSASLTSDVGAAGPDTQDIDVVEPNLLLTKAVDNPNPTLGDEVTFTITVAHNSSTADAHDVLITDVIPAGLTYILGSHLGDGSVDETDPTQPEFDLGTITLVEMSKQFTFRCRVDADAAIGVSLTNTANGDYSSQNGTPAVDRSYMTSGMVNVTPSEPMAFIDAVKTVAISNDLGTAGVVDPGDELTYTITLSHTGIDAENAVFTDTVPANTTYVAASLTSSVGGEDDSGNPDLSVDLGTMTMGDTITITFAVTVDGGTPSGTVISNQGLVDSDQTTPEPTDEDGVDANGDQPTEIPVGGPPMLNNGLYVQKVVAWLIDADASGDVTAGDTMRYSLVFLNVGDGALSNVTLTDTIPSGLTYVAASASITGGGNSINVIGANVSVTLPGLAVGGSESAQFDVTVDAFGGMTQTYVNQAAVDSNETDPDLSDSNGNPSDGNQPTEFQAVNGVAGTPDIDVEKRWSLAIDNDGDGLVDPGDTLEYIITVVNMGSATATDTRLNDTIPADTTVVTGSANASSGIVVTEDPLLVNIGNLDPGEVVTVIFRVTVDGGTPDGTIIPNQGTVTADGGINEPSDDNGNDADGLNPTLTPVDTGGGSGVGTPTGLAKSLQAHSETDSTNPQVFIGEVLTWRVTFAAPAGLLREVTLTDTLDSGLSYLAGTARLARNFDTGLSASQDPGGINSTATGVFVGLADGSELMVSGQNLSLFLGDLINSDNDLNAETYVLEIQVLVENIAGNFAGVSLNNSATISYLNGLDQLQSLTPVNDSVTVIEPNLGVSKTANPQLMLQFGGDIEYTVVITNPAGANVGTGYDVNITDTLPRNLYRFNRGQHYPRRRCGGDHGQFSGYYPGCGCGHLPAGRYSDHCLHCHGPRAGGARRYRQHGHGHLDIVARRPGNRQRHPRQQR